MTTSIRNQLSSMLNATLFPSFVEFGEFTHHEAQVFLNEMRAIQAKVTTEGDYRLGQAIINALPGRSPNPKIFYETDETKVLEWFYKQLVISDEPTQKWSPFWFEGNNAWGRIESPEDWERIKRAYPDTDLTKASQYINSTLNVPYYGFAFECNSQNKLGDFFTENEMTI